MNKEKINWKFVFAVSIPVTVVISIISVFIIIIVNNTHHCGRDTI